ncbi:hypothetical protein M9458_050351 [Cirrhinus mrigala]|uniref:DUF4371 domain-containing protein n=1 Tax=Cirrhinus mrigala TaxID=683832 RepID=A0ABD0MWN2_CIRMR
MSPRPHPLDLTDQLDKEADLELMPSGQPTSSSYNSSSKASTTSALIQGNMNQYQHKILALSTSQLQISWKAVRKRDIFSCVKAVEKRLINEDSVRFDSSFVKGGFTNWRKATEKFNEHENPFCGLTADGTTDSSTMEQFSLTLQYVDEKLESHSDFLGFYSAPDSSGETLFRCIKDVFLRLNIPLERLHGYCFDGASNMSGRFSGVQAWLKKTCPESLFVHCANHSLDLVLQEAAREVGLIADSVNFVQGVAVVICESAKRKDLYQSLPYWPYVQQDGAYEQQLSNEITKTMEQLKEDRSVRGDIRAKIRGLHKQAMKAKTYYGLLCCEAIFEPCESVARSLQHTKASALGALKCAELLERRMEALRDDAVVDKMPQTVSSAGLKMPDEKRMTKTPTRYQHTAEPEAESQVAQHSLWRQEFYEAVDLVRAEVKRRFDQDGMKTAALRENMLITAANKKQIVDVDSVHLPHQIDKDWRSS